MSDDVHLRPLGGVGRFGRNALLIDADGGDAIIVDCGVRFLDDEEAPGFDFALPDLAAIAAVAPRLRAYVITHGHEDHIGALPYAFLRAPARIITLPFTKDVIARRFARAGVALPDVEVVEPGPEIALGALSVRFIAVSHSIPDASAVVVETPQGVVVLSGDFRIDAHPLAGPPTDVDALAALAARDVRVLFTDSAGALSDAAPAGEASVVAPLTDAMADAPALVVVGVYGSHHQRVCAVAEACRRTGRRLLLLGASVLATAKAARARGLVTYDDVLAPLSALDDTLRRALCVVVPGCQGERGSTLERVARDDHPRLALERGDRVVVSAKPIPGNERALARMLDRFAARGVDVVDGGDGRHVSGHGPAQDLARLMELVRPRHVVALHGGDRHLAAHRALAADVLGPDAPITLRDGDTLTLGPRGHRVTPTTASAEPFLHGRTVVDDPAPLVDVRRRMMRAGTLAIALDPEVHVAGAGLDPALDGRALRTLTRVVEHHARDGEAAVETALRQACRRLGAATPHLLFLTGGQHDGAADRLPDDD